jgi:ribosomal protein S18 acetylase RimI-like enzyme
LSCNSTQNKPSNLAIQAVDFDVRPALWQEMSIVVRLICSTVEWYAKWHPGKDLMAYYTHESWKERNFREREFFIGYANGQAVGTVSFQHCGAYGYLGYLYLDQKQMGKRYGQHLLYFAETLASVRNLKGLVLIVHPEAVWAVKAYEKFGFTRILSDKASILRWENGVLESYYDDGFHLFQYDLRKKTVPYKDIPC